jgi:hypothetical protein
MLMVAIAVAVLFSNCRLVSPLPSLVVRPVLMVMSLQNGFVIVPSRHTGDIITSGERIFIPPRAAQASVYRDGVQLLETNEEDRQ